MTKVRQSVVGKLQFLIRLKTKGGASLIIPMTEIKILQDNGYTGYVLRVRVFDTQLITDKYSDIPLKIKKRLRSLGHIIKRNKDLITKRIRKKLFGIKQ